MDKKTINEDIDNIHIKALSIKLFYILFTNVTPNKINFDICVEFLIMLIEATQNFTVNKQGDVGLNIRLFAVEYIPRTLLCFINPPFCFSIEKYMLENLICSILRQSAEKVQKLRSIARIAFVELFKCDNCLFNQQLSVVDNYNEILEFIRGDEIDIWLNDTNSLIVNYHMLQYQTYASSSFLGILAFLSSSGFVDLENRIIKNACYNLEIESNNPESIKNVCNAIQYIISNYSTDIRIRDSLIICVEPLISLNILTKFDHIIESEILITNLLDFLSVAAKSILNVSRLKQIIDSIIALIDITNSSFLRYKCLTQASKFIGHQFPIVRVYAVQKIFMYLSVVESVYNLDQDKINQLQSILLDTQWDLDLPLIEVQLSTINQLITL